MHSRRRNKKIFLSWINFLVLRKTFVYFLDLRPCFSNQENISLLSLRHLQCERIEEKRKKTNQVSTVMNIDEIV